MALTAEQEKALAKEMREHMEREGLKTTAKQEQWFKDQEEN
jgi:hypothetical protein